MHVPLIGTFPTSPIVTGYSEGMFGQVMESYKIITNLGDKMGCEVDARELHGDFDRHNMENERPCNCTGVGEISSRILFADRIPLSKAGICNIRLFLGKVGLSPEKKLRTGFILWCFDG